MVLAQIFFTGDPKPKGRPRTRVRQSAGGKAFAQVYTDDQTKDYEGSIEAQMREALRIWARDDSIVGVLKLPLEKRVIMAVRFNLKKPVSSPKSLEHQLKKPDLDNLVKSVLDGMTNSGFLRDDNVITDVYMYKRFASQDHPVGVEVNVTAWQ